MVHRKPETEERGAKRQRQDINERTINVRGRGTGMGMGVCVRKTKRWRRRVALHGSRPGALPAETLPLGARV